jgi:hypothetical protein
MNPRTPARGPLLAPHLALSLGRRLGLRGGGGEGEREREREREREGEGEREAEAEAEAEEREREQRERGRGRGRNRMRDGERLRDEDRQEVGGNGCVGWVGRGSGVVGREEGEKGKKGEEGEEGRDGGMGRSLHENKKTDVQAKILENPEKS